MFRFPPSDVLNTVLLPGAPERPMSPLRFSNVTANSVTLDWLPPRDNGGAPITGYKVEISNDEETWTNLALLEGDGTQLRVADLQQGRPYYFRVAAMNKVGTGKAIESDRVVPKRPVGECEI